MLQLRGIYLSFLLTGLMIFVFGQLPLGAAQHSNDAGFSMLQSAAQLEWESPVTWAARGLFAVLLIFFFLLYRREFRISRSDLVLPFLIVVVFGFLGCLTSFLVPTLIRSAGTIAVLYFAGLRYWVFRPIRKTDFMRAVLPILFLITLYLGMLAIDGPSYFWSVMATSELLRRLFLVVSVLLAIFHIYFVFYLAALRNQSAKVIRRFLLVTGGIMTTYGLLYLISGDARMLNFLETEIALVPGMDADPPGLLVLLATSDIYLIGIGLGFIIASLTLWRFSRPHSLKPK